MAKTQTSVGEGIIAVSISTLLSNAIVPSRRRHPLSALIFKGAMAKTRMNGGEGAKIPSRLHDRRLLYISVFAIVAQHC